MLDLYCVNFLVRVSHKRYGRRSGERKQSLVFKLGRSGQYTHIVVYLQAHLFVEGLHTNLHMLYEPLGPPSASPPLGAGV